MNFVANYSLIRS